MLRCSFCIGWSILSLFLILPKNHNIIFGIPKKNVLFVQGLKNTVGGDSPTIMCFIFLSRCSSRDCCSICNYDIHCIHGSLPSCKCHMRPPGLSVPRPPVPARWGRSFQAPPADFFLMAPMGSLANARYPITAIIAIAISRLGWNPDVYSSQNW